LLRNYKNYSLKKITKHGDKVIPIVFFPTFAPLFVIDAKHIVNAMTLIKN
jgi:hypothetical protein